MHSKITHDPLFRFIYRFLIVYEDYEDYEKSYRNFTSFEPRGSEGEKASELNRESSSNMGSDSADIIRGSSVVTEVGGGY